MNDLPCKFSTANITQRDFSASAILSSSRNDKKRCQFLPKANRPVAGPDPILPAGVAVVGNIRFLTFCLCQQRGSSYRKYQPSNNLASHIRKMKKCELNKTPKQLQYFSPKLRRA